MNWIWQWIIDSLPWWTWYAVGGVVLLLTMPWWISIWRILPGWMRWILGGFAVSGAAYLAGRNKGKQNEIARQKARDQGAVDTRKRTDARIDTMTDQQKDKELDPWYRD